MWLFYYLTKKVILRWAVDESLQWAWEHVILWEIFQIQPTKDDRLSKNALWHKTYASSCPSRKPPMRVFQVTSSNFSAICESWKHQSFEWMGFEIPTSGSDYCFFCWSAHQDLQTRNFSPSTRWHKVSMWIKTNSKVFVFMSYLNWVLV